MQYLLVLLTFSSNSLLSLEEKESNCQLLYLLFTNFVTFVVFVDLIPFFSELF